VCTCRTYSNAVAALQACSNSRRYSFMTEENGFWAKGFIFEAKSLMLRIALDLLLSRWSFDFWSSWKFDCGFWVLRSRNLINGAPYIMWRKIWNNLGKIYYKKRHFWILIIIFYIIYFYFTCLGCCWNFCKLWKFGLKFWNQQLILMIFH